MHVVGTEHILLGLVREGDGAAARVLERLGISLGRVRAELARQVSAPEGHVVGATRLTLSPKAKKALEYALQEARELNQKLGLQDYVDTEHLLLGLMRKGSGSDNTAIRLLEGLGLDIEQMHREVMIYLGIIAPTQAPAAEQGTPDAPPKQFSSEAAYAQALALGIRVFEQSKSFPAAEVGSLTDNLRRASRAVCLHLMLPDQVSSPLRNRDYRDVTRDILHTRTLLDFAAGYGYLDEEEADRLKAAYGELLNAYTGS